MPEWEPWVDISFDSIDGTCSSADYCELPQALARCQGTLNIYGLYLYIAKEETFNFFFLYQVLSDQQINTNQLKTKCHLS